MGVLKGVPCLAHLSHPPRIQENARREAAIQAAQVRPTPDHGPERLQVDCVRAASQVGSAQQAAAQEAGASL